MGQRAHETAGDQITGQGHDRKRVRQFLRIARRTITDIRDNEGHIRDGTIRPSDLAASGAAWPMLPRFPQTDHRVGVLGWRKRVLL
jgi:hypothetical protein